MILSLSQTRRFTLLLLLALFTCILFLSFVPNSHSYYSKYTTPPTPAPKSTFSNFKHPPPPASPTDPSCDPFALETHLHLNQSFPLESYFTTYDPTCKTSNPLWLTQLANLGPDDPPVEALKDRTVLFLGDSVDRFVLHDLCIFLNGTFSMHPVDTYKSAVNETVKAHGGLPRSCFINGPSGKQGLVLLSYFFYGFDEDDMWRDKVSTWSSPARFSDRWSTFEFEAYPSVFGDDGILRGRAGPDLVFVNMGLWELARFDRIDEQKQMREGVDEEKLIDPVTVSEGFVEEFIEKTVDMLGKVRRLVGDGSRIRWRQMHTPTISSGPYFKDPTGKKKKSRGRFTPVKISVLNKAASWACEVASGKEIDRRRREGVERREVERKGRSWWRRVGDDEEWEEEEMQSRRREDGRVTVWPVGDLIAPWPTGQWLRDDIHPTEQTGMTVWGSGVFEYLARTPRGSGGERTQGDESVDSLRW